MSGEDRVRLILRILGQDLIDVELHRHGADASSPAPDRGDCTTYPIGFVAHMDKPHEIDTPDRDW